MASLRLDDQLCFGLYSASRAVTSLYRVVLEDLDLTYPQYLVMLALWEKDHRLVKELGAELNLDSGTLSPLLKRLQTAGLVIRNRQADDERSVRVSLSETGQGAAREGAGHPRRDRRGDGPGRSRGGPDARRAGPVDGVGERLPGGVVPA